MVQTIRRQSYANYTHWLLSIPTRAERREFLFLSPLLGHTAIHIVFQRQLMLLMYGGHIGCSRLIATASRVSAVNYHSPLTVTIQQLRSRYR